MEDVQSRTVLASPPGIPEELRNGSSSTSEGLDRAGKDNGNPMESRLSETGVLNAREHPAKQALGFAGAAGTCLGEAVQGVS